MSEVLQVLSIISIVMGFASGLLALYVTGRLATFESRLIYKLNGLYQRTDNSKLIQAQNQREHDRFDNEFSTVWAEINRQKGRG